MKMIDYDGRTALHIAAAEGHPRCVSFLLDVCGVPFDCQDRWGQTPLSEAIRFKRLQVAAILRRYERSKEKKEHLNTGAKKIVSRKSNKNGNKLELIHKFHLTLAVFHLGS